MSVAVDDVVAGEERDFADGAEEEEGRVAGFLV